jgi:myo-inositol-1(or 4)-monophosphatase
MRINGSAALDLCSVACGRLDIYYEYCIHAWDICAGAIIVKEAGGVVKDPTGQEFTLTNGKVIAGNATIVKKLLDLITHK